MEIRLSGGRSSKTANTSSIRLIMKQTQGGTTIVLIKFVNWLQSQMVAKLKGLLSTNDIA